jgi:hypothetical protein
MKNKIIFFFFMLSLNSNAIQTLAQEMQQEVLVISEKVGEEIDRKEREKYGLFPAVENFVSAKFIKTASDSLMLQLVVDKAGKPTMRNIPISYISMKSIARQIESFEEFEKEMSERRKPTVEKSKPELLKEIELEKSRRVQLFPGYLGSLFGGWVTVAALADFDIKDLSKMEFYTIWGLGSAFFSALIIHSSGKFGRAPALLPLTFLGSAVGSGLGILLFEGTLKINSSGLAVLVLVFAKPILTSLGGIEGYHAAVKQRLTDQESGLINFRERKFAVRIPNLSIRLAQGTGLYDSRDIACQIELLHVSF